MPCLVFSAMSVVLDRWNRVRSLGFGHEKHLEHKGQAKGLQDGQSDGFQMYHLLEEQEGQPNIDPQDMSPTDVKRPENKIFLQGNPINNMVDKGKKIVKK